MPKRLPTYSPGSDSSLTMWIDPSDSTTLLNTTGGAITNGATIGTCTSKDSTHYAFTQWGTNARPTWDSSGINGLGAIRSNVQGLTTTTNTGFTTMSGFTAVCVTKLNTDIGGYVLGFTMHNPGDFGNPNITMTRLRSTSSYSVGGRRTGTDSLQDVTGNSIPSSKIYLECGAFDYSNAKLSLFESGVEGLQQQTFQTTGTTGGTDPAMISLGCFAQDGGGGKVLGAPMDGWIGEILAWNAVLTPDQLFAPHTYLRLKWGGGLM